MFLDDDDAPTPYRSVPHRTIPPPPHHVIPTILGIIPPSTFDLRPSTYLLHPPHSGVILPYLSFFPSQLRGSIRFGPVQFDRVQSCFYQQHSSSLTPYMCLSKTAGTGTGTGRDATGKHISSRSIMIERGAGSMRFYRLPASAFVLPSILAYLVLCYFLAGRSSGLVQLGSLGVFGRCVAFLVSLSPARVSKISKDTYPLRVHVYLLHLQSSLITHPSPSSIQRSV